jgi:hypothetical protein
MTTTADTLRDMASYHLAQMVIIGHGHPSAQKHRAWADLLTRLAGEHDAKDAAVVANRERDEA